MKISRLQKLLAAVCTVATFSARSFADVDAWSGNSGNWSDPDNWSLQAVPGSDDNVELPSNGETVTLDVDGSIAGLADNGGVGATLSIPGTTLNASGDVEITNMNVTGGATIDAGSLTVSSLSLTQSTLQGPSFFDGTFYVSNSTSTASTSFDVQANSTITNSTLAGVSGTIESGNALTVGESSLSSNSGNVTDYGTFNLNNGSSINGLDFLGVENGGTTILNGSQITLSASGIEDQIEVNQPSGATSTLEVTNSSTLSDGGNRTTALSNAGEVLVNSGGQVNVRGIYNSDALTVSDSGSNLVGRAIIDNSQGTFTIENSATASTQQLYVGTPGPSGAADTTATVAITNGGQLTIASMGSNFLGNLIVSGSGSFTVTGSLVMDDGPLTVSTGGSISASTLTLDRRAPVTATIDGSGSSINASAAFSIDGNSTATVQNNAKINVTGTADGNGIFVGDNTANTTGTLTVQSGGGVNTSGISIAPVVNSKGLVTLTGAGSQLNYSGQLVVANYGIGILNVDKGAVLNQTGIQDSVLGGSSTNAEGAVFVDGAGSQWTLARLDDGELGQGSLDVTNGGNVTCGTADLAAILGSTGSAFIAGAGSKLTVSGPLTVGAGGTGSMMILNSGVVSATDVNVAEYLDSSGQIFLGSGAQLNYTGIMTVGNTGNGSLNIENGGVVNQNSGPYSIVGQAANSTGFVSVTDSGSQWNTGPLVVGQYGEGAIDVTNGGSIYSTGTANLGEYVGSTGSVFVAGTGSSTWTNTGDLIVGYSGTGSLAVLSGGTVSNANGIVGEYAFGSVAVLGGTWTNTAALTIGAYAAGSMNITGGTVTDVGGATVGAYAGSAGTVTLYGTTSGISSWYTNGQLTVGNSGQGQLSITQGSLVASTSGAIGYGGGYGYVSIDGSGSTWIANSPGGNGIIVIGQNGYGALTVSNQGKVIANAIYVDAGGILTSIGGTVAAAVYVNGGSLSTAYGTTLDLSGTLTQSAGYTLLGGRLALTGLTITGGTFDVGTGSLVLSYSGSDPIASIQSYLTNGYNSGSWNGSGIISSAVAAANASQGSLIYSVGYADGADGLVNGLPSGQIEVIPTLAGDAKLQGNVVFGDFQIFAANFGSSAGWDGGNFTYGSIVNFGDFQLLAQNFGKTSSGLTASELASINTFAAIGGEELQANSEGGYSLVSVPEPMSFSIVTARSVGIMARRRRKTC